MYIIFIECVIKNLINVYNFNECMRATVQEECTISTSEPAKKITWYLTPLQYLLLLILIGKVNLNIQLYLLLTVKYS